MNSDALKPGLRVAYRDGRKPGTPLQRVEVVDGILKARQVRVHFLDGDDAGLLMWVRQERLVCAWANRARFLRDEQRFERLRDDWIKCFDPVIERAMQSVVVATGEVTGFQIGWYEHRDVFARLWARAGLDDPPLAHPLAYKMGGGYLNLPWDTVVRFCVAFCAREPEIVLSLVEARRHEYQARGHDYGERYHHSLMRQHAGPDAVVKDWCGAERAREDLRKEIKRLNGLIGEAVRELDAAGLTKAAQRLQRGLRGL